MAEIGLRSGKVRAGFYRFGEFCMHRTREGWMVMKGPCFIGTHPTLSDAYSWCRRQPH